MKKLVLFTLVLVVCLSGSAFALLNDNAVAVNDAQAASDNGVNVDASKAAVAALGAQSATSGGTNKAVDVDVDVQGNAIAKGQAATNGGTNTDRSFNTTDAFKTTGSFNTTDAFKTTDSFNNNSTNDNRFNPVLYVVDNAILANYNTGKKPGNQNITFTKNQTSTISGFGGATGVSNANSAAGNMNDQTAYTSISIGSIGSTSSHR